MFWSQNLSFPTREDLELICTSQWPDKQTKLTGDTFPWRVACDFHRWKNKSDQFAIATSELQRTREGSTYCEKHFCCLWTRVRSLLSCCSRPAVAAVEIIYHVKDGSGGRLFRPKGRGPALDQSEAITPGQWGWGCGWSARARVNLDWWVRERRRRNPRPTSGTAKIETRRSWTCKGCDKTPDLSFPYNNK